MLNLKYICVRYLLHPWETIINFVEKVEISPEFTWDVRISNCLLLQIWNLTFCWAYFCCLSIDNKFREGFFHWQKLVPFVFSAENNLLCSVIGRYPSTNTFLFSLESGNEGPSFSLTVGMTVLLVTYPLVQLKDRNGGWNFISRLKSQRAGVMWTGVDD